MSTLGRGGKGDLHIQKKEKRKTRSEKEWMEVCYLNEVRTEKDRQSFRYRTEKTEIRIKKEKRKMRSNKEQMEV